MYNEHRTIWVLSPTNNTVWSREKAPGIGYRLEHDSIASKLKLCHQVAEPVRYPKVNMVPSRPHRADEKAAQCRNTYQASKRAVLQVYQEHMLNVSKTMHFVFLLSTNNFSLLYSVTSDRRPNLSASRSLSTQFTDSFAQTESTERAIGVGSDHTDSAGGVDVPKIVEKDMIDSGVVDKSERISPSGSVSSSFVDRLRYSSVGEDEAIIVDNVPSSQEVFVT